MGCGNCKSGKRRNGIIYEIYINNTMVYNEFGVQAQDALRARREARGTENGEGVTTEDEWALEW